MGEWLPGEGIPELVEVVLKKALRTIAVRFVKSVTLQTRKLTSRRDTRGAVCFSNILLGHKRRFS